MSESIRVTDLSESSNNGLTPTQQQVLNTTNPPQAFKLPSGRTITFKKPSGIASLQTAKLLGVQSANQMLTLYYRAGLSIASLNGKPVSPPKSELEMDGLFQRLADDFDETIILYMRWMGYDIPGETTQETDGEPDAKK